MDTAVASGPVTRQTLCHNNDCDGSFQQLERLKCWRIAVYCFSLYRYLSKFSLQTMRRLISFLHSPPYQQCIKVIEMIRSVLRPHMIINVLVLTKFSAAFWNFSKTLLIFFTQSFPFCSWSFSAGTFGDRSILLPSFWAKVSSISVRSSSFYPDEDQFRILFGHWISAILSTFPHTSVMFLVSC